MGGKPSNPTRFDNLGARLGSKKPRQFGCPSIFGPRLGSGAPDKHTRLNAQFFLDQCHEEGIEFFCGTPDSTLKHFLTHLASKIKFPNHVVTANEGAALSMAAGHYMATGKVKRNIFCFSSRCARDLPFFFLPSGPNARPCKPL